MSRGRRLPGRPHSLALRSFLAIGAEALLQHVEDVAVVLFTDRFEPSDRNASDATAAVIQLGADSSARAGVIADVVSTRNLSDR